MNQQPQDQGGSKSAQSVEAKISQETKSLSRSFVELLTESGPTHEPLIVEKQLSFAKHQVYFEPEWRASQ
ncbi:unnamed protein product [Allacma fusca]|uniref:Uncharacterized protein n=1 Tax=Allacma fusca TaxID=39272 RepID=A0A8J2JZ58_9HEXA|nr:unnamed protein product [Allacma fusca]